ncbi:cobyric acid synthase [Marinomonas agarivorans]|nr:cobyric acid synthase [Marinomonas agarivorans]
MPPFSLMIQGTTSDAGKSTLATALCRLLKRRGVAVAPFKPQNMALNSAVTAEGGEIGRAQAVQAYAAGIEPHIHMNPILLKPNTDIGAQVIIQGQAIGNMNARQYHDYKDTAKEAVLDSYQTLLRQYDAIIIEGAGSPAEINLRAKDIANMGFAESVNAPVIIIADIDKGGVFAHLVGTLDLLAPAEQDRVIGFVINRFRGDIRLLQSGLDWLEQKTGKPVLGVLPYLSGFHLESEDAVATNALPAKTEVVLTVVIPITPRISNHTDWDPLRLHPQVDVILVKAGQDFPPADLVILPGSKSVQSDLAYLRQQGFDTYLQRHLRYGGKVIGVCGGYQMLGQHLTDPLALENDKPVSTTGFGLIPMTTELAPQKQLHQQVGYLYPNAHWQGEKPQRITGYEIHAGVSSFTEDIQAFCQLDDGRDEGYVSSDQQIIGTYLHGLFDHIDSLQALLQWAGIKQAQTFDYQVLKEQEIERLADSCEQHMDIDALLTKAKAFKPLISE